MFFKKLSYGDVFLILRIAHQDSKGRGKKEGKGSIVFLGGGIFVESGLLQPLQPLQAAESANCAIVTLPLQ